MEDEEEEEEEEEVMLEEENLEAEPQIELKGADEEVRVEEADASPGPSRPAATTQPPDEEQAGLELICYPDEPRKTLPHTLTPRIRNLFCSKC